MTHHCISAEIMPIKAKLITHEEIQTISCDARESQLYSMSNDTKNARTCMVMWKSLYVHQLNTADTAHIIGKLQIQSRIGGVGWRWWELANDQI